MKYLLILLLSTMSTNYLFGGPEFNACKTGYNARPPMMQQNGLATRGGIDPAEVQNLKSLYTNIDEQNAALWGYYYAGCSDQDGNHRYGAYTGWFAEQGYGVLGQANNGAYGWVLNPNCWPEATQGDGAVCADKFSPS